MLQLVVINMFCNNVDEGILKIQDRQCTYNVPFRRVRAATVVVEKQ